jgi:hypothetical protein
LVDFHEIWYGGDEIQGDFDAIISNPIAPTILKWLRFKFVSWRHDFKAYTAMVWDCLIVGLLWLHQIQSLADVTMETIAIGKVSKLVLPRTSCLYSKTSLPNVTMNWTAAHSDVSSYTAMFRSHFEWYSEQWLHVN